MTLMALGPVQFDAVLNPQKTSKESESSFAVHEPIGAMPIREDTGEKDTTFEIQGVIWPHHFGGLGSLALLEKVRLAKIPIPYMRGSLTPMGWVLILKLKVDDEELDGAGIGAQINFTVSLVLADRPSAGLSSQILSLFL